MSGIYKVGEHLEMRALGAVADDEIDRFGRSAFNRYYYATFLAARDLLRKLNPKWKTPPHKDMPVFFKKTVIRVLHRQIEKGEDSGSIQRRRGGILRLQTSQAGRDLAALMDQAREVRRIADYVPSFPATKIDGSVLLAGESLARAKKWRRQAERSIKVIEDAYREVGLI